MLLVCLNGVDPVAEWVVDTDYPVDWRLYSQLQCSYMLFCLKGRAHNSHKTRGFIIIISSGISGFSPFKYACSRSSRGRPAADANRRSNSDCHANTELSC